jgi:cytochrome c-type biogenesis protein CcmE
MLLGPHSALRGDGNRVSGEQLVNREQQRMSPSVKLAWGAGIVVGVTAYMAYVGASASWQYYVTADECVARAAELIGSRVRVSGGVAAGSLQLAADRSQASFQLQGARSRLNVVCTGPLPDNLAEDIDVVVEGQLEAGGRLRGDKLLTRCASKYESQKLGSGSPGSNAHEITSP